MTRILIKSKIAGRGGGYIKTSNLAHGAHIFLSYQNHPEIIKKAQEFLLKHYDLIEEFRGRLNQSSKPNPKFNKLLNKNVKVNVWNVKKAKYELVKIKDLEKQK